MVAVMADSPNFNQLQTQVAQLQSHFGLTPSSTSSGPMTAIVVGTPIALHGHPSSLGPAAELFMEDGSVPSRALSILESTPPRDLEFYSLPSPSGSLPSIFTTDPSQVYSRRSHAQDPLIVHPQRILESYMNRAMERSVDCKWVFSVKYLADGYVDRYEAYLVSKGFTQIPGKDFGATFAPVKRDLRMSFDNKDLGPLRYFLSIEVARSGKGISLSQQKYSLDFLQDTNMLGCRPTSTPIVPNHRISAGSEELLRDLSIYQWLVDRLIYLTNTRLDLTFAVSVVSQFMHSPRTSHVNVVYHILRYLKTCPGLGLFYKSGTQSGLSCFTDTDYAATKSDKRSTFGFCTFHSSHLIS
ncbi:hypothetical protein Acr_17g0014000 [Actinidia rufa]|uniref:Reverse transcriptase Ty1/copia-type domain-containing protein n=1 Tax=Actinidia rufa TaxID=165716 RepID=A0A7J0G4V7_9ERIC|nr:hypothetical protein Acr_17g0014000 [Actinidia rufa]